MRAAELIGLVLVVYGVWFGFRGVKMYLGDDKSWWRQPSRKERYPYPAAGFLLGVVFVLAGLAFLLHFAWANARILGYVAGGIFLVVLIIGTVQPRILHPRWYGQLERQFGRKGMDQLRAAAYALPIEEWREVIASNETFNAWVVQTAPAQPRHQSRAYKGGERR